jgi:DNA-binding NarL/FixJ family response regulator
MTAVPARVVIVDDHATFVRAVALLFDDDSDVDVIGTASNGDEAVELALRCQPDVVLMDISMPTLDGIEATRRIVESAPHVAVVVLTMFDDDAKVAAAIQAGARGYLLKGASQQEIRAAIAAAHRGEAIFGPVVARRLAGLLSAPRDQPHPFPALTGRERDVLDQLAAGLDNAAIARALFLSEKTVRNYASLIFAKLGVASRAEAIVTARDAGLGLS